MVDSGKKKNIFDRLLIAMRPKKEPADIVEYAEKIIRDLGSDSHRSAGRVKRSCFAPLAAISVTVLAIAGLIYGTLKIFL